MEDDQISRLLQAKFCILLVLSISSVTCSILIVIYFYRRRKKVSLHHHLPLTLIVMSFIQMISDFPFAMVYYHYGIVHPSSNSFCLWWNWWSYSISGAPILVMSWGSIERHFLIFHNTLMSTRRKRFIFHILPMFIFSIYPFIFYLAAIIFDSCQNQWDYQFLLCLQPCYLISQLTLSLYDSLANIAVPIGIITLANGILIIRVLWKKRNRREASHRQRKLTIQLLSIAALYMIMWFPLTVNGLIYTFTLSSISGDLQGKYFLFLPSILAMLIPFVSLPFLSDFKKILFKGQQNTVVPYINNNGRLPNRNLSNF